MIVLFNVDGEKDLYEIVFLRMDEDRVEFVEVFEVVVVEYKEFCVN